MIEKLIFSNDYDSRVHIDFNKISAAGVKFVGPMGLLGELELRAGLICLEPVEYERVACFKKAIADHLDHNPNSIFTSSFLIDADTVAKQLLKWRDDLVMAGWNGTQKIESALLKELSEIEAEFNHSQYNSVADRWMRVLDYCTKNSLKGFGIEVVGTKEQVNPTIVAVLDVIQNGGIVVKYIPMKDTNPEIVAYQFEDLYDAYLAAVLTLDPKKDVIVNQDTKAFNNFLNLVSMGNTMSTLKDCNAPILQLFKLELLLLAEPNNIFNMVSYLKTKPCPVKGGGMLADYLMRQCGWGSEKDWDDFITRLTNIMDTASVQAFKDNMTNHDGDKNKGLYFLQAQQRIKELKQWAERQVNAAASRNNGYQLSATQKSEFDSLRGFCNQFLSIDKDAKDIVKPEDLAYYAETIYQNGEYENTTAEVDTFDAYDSLGNIYSPLTDGMVVWIDCYGEPYCDYDYDFLSVDDKTALISAGVRIWSIEDQIATKIASLKAAAKGCGQKLCIFVPLRSKGETLPSHPLLSCLGIKPNKSYPLNKSSVEVVKLPECKLYYTISPNLIKPRQSPESYSSLHLLINSPLDYVMQYLAGIYAPNISNLESLMRIEGLIGHKTLENLTNDCAKDPTQMLLEVQNNLDKRIREAAKQVGLVMLLEENTIEFGNLMDKLKVSYINLLNIIIGNKLNIVGMEMRFLDGKSAITSRNADIEANIDLVLEDASHKRYIFDLKYSNPKSYRDSLAINQGKVMQLDIYKHCMNISDGSDVVFTGFFMLTDGKLYTTNSLLSGNNVVVVHLDPDRSLERPIEALTNGYGYRYNEFENGQIEEGEGTDCKRASARSTAKEDICYYRDQDTDNLYPIDLNGNKKASNQYSNFKIFKGGLK